MKLLLPLLLAALLLGCGANTPTPVTTGTSGPLACGASCGGPLSSSEPVVPTQATAAAKLSADQVVSAFKDTGLPIGAVQAYDAGSDPNHLLGRPGQYTGKATFVDTRLPAPRDPAQLEVNDGGSVETFDSAGSANTRAQYVAAISQSSSLLVEYDYLSGLTLLRLSHVLTPDQAQQYSVALAKVTNAPSVAVTPIPSTPVR